jgi:hypothetical protein
MITKGMSPIQILRYLEKQNLIKYMDSVYYLTDKLLAIADDAGSPKEALHQFCKDAEVPFQAISPEGRKYTIKYVTTNIGKTFQKVLKKVDRDKLVEVTKRYYKDTGMPVTIKRYLEENVWEAALEELNTFPISGTSFNKFED